MPRDIFADLPREVEVKPRDVTYGPRCPACKSPDPKGMPPMFHMAHPFGPCELYSDRYGLCGCTYEEEENGQAD